MPNWNPLTNASGGGGATTANTYYNVQPTNFGEYQFIKLTEIVENFIAAYIGEGKILASALKGDVNFHAHRALQELSYDTLKSCKSQEIEVCPSLKMPLPHDYVNYVKVTSVDANGIEHIIYPTRHTSHPFAIEQDDDCAYVSTDGTLTHQETCEEGVETTCDATAVNGFLSWGENWINGTNTWPVYPIITGTIYNGSIAIVDVNEAWNIAVTFIDDHCICLASGGDNCPNCGECNGGGGGYNPWSGGAKQNQRSGDVNGNSEGNGNGSGRICWDGNDFADWMAYYSFPSCGPFISLEDCTLTSDAWTNYSSNGSSSSSSSNNSLSIDSLADNYFQNTGERYGLQPEHAQANGSFFIDCMRGNIHFGSNFSGKTIILHYISDHHGTEDEEIVHKFAEEAMYKWIAYGCLSARADTPEYVIQRFKKEKFAETRKAKIRLSNIKIEEIAQIMRNKSKWINH